MSDFVKVPCNFWEKYTGTCLNTWNEHAWHWATPVFMLRFVRFLSVWQRAARHFYGCTHFLSWHKSGKKNSRTHSYTVTDLGTHIHAQAHGHTVILSLSTSLSLTHTDTHTHSTIHVHFVHSNGNVSFQLFFAPLATLLIFGTSHQRDDCSVTFLDDHLYLMRYSVAVVWKCSNLEDVLLVEFMYLAYTRTPGDSYCRRLRSLLLYLCYLFRALINFPVGWFRSNLFLFYLKIKLKKILFYHQKCKLSFLSKAKSFVQIFITAQSTSSRLSVSLQPTGSYTGSVSRITFMYHCHLHACKRDFNVIPWAYFCLTMAKGYQSH